MPMLFNGQMLLTPPLAKSFPEQVMLVTTQYSINEAWVELTLTAPGLAEDRLNTLRTMLCRYLQHALDVHPDWVQDVKEEVDAANLDGHSTPGRKITVHINNPRLMGDESEELVLNEVHTFMKVWTKGLWLKTFVLTGRQVLVPLDFEVPELLGSSLTVRLPQELQLAGPYARNAGTDDLEKLGRACNELKQTLRGMLTARGHAWRHLNVDSGREGVKIEILFSSVNPPKPFQLNDIEEIICIVLRMYARHPGVRDQLVFAPTNRHEANLYADDEPFMRDVEY
jgi:hypothetical protein